MSRSVAVLVVFASLGSLQASSRPLRDDGIEVVRVSSDSVKRACEGDGVEEYPFSPFPADMQARALDGRTVDWRGTAAVTTVKDQGPHGYCGTFGRIASAEGQFGLRSGYGARNFSVEQLIDCVGWDLDQTSAIEGLTPSMQGLMSEEDYPYNISAYPDQDPPVPGNPCLFDSSKTIPGTIFSNHTSVTASYGEDMFATAIFAWGPLQCGVNADVFGERGDDNFVTAQGCAAHAGEDIDHSITVVGFGTDETHGDFWIIKNSWGVAFAESGFIFMPRGINCGSILEANCGLYTVGDPADYYPWLTQGVWA